MDINAVKAYMNQWMEENKQEFYTAADEIWAYPELGLEETRAFGILTGLLKNMALRWRADRAACLPPLWQRMARDIRWWGSTRNMTACRGCLRNATRLIPAQCRREPRGQGCGHNLLGTTAVFSAVALRHAVEYFRIPCTIKVLGSPYEEAGVGKALIGREGVYRDLDLIMDWHPWNYNRADYDRCNPFSS